MSRLLPVLLFLGFPSLALSDAVQFDVKKTIRYSETLLITLSVEGGDGLQVESPGLDSSPEWSILRQPRGEMTRLETGRWRWRREIELEPIKPGELKLPTLVVRHRLAPDAPWTVWNREGEVIEVKGPEGKKVRGHLPVEPVPGDNASTGIPYLEVVIGLVLAILLTVALWWWKTPRPVVTLPADQRALRELERLRTAPPGTIHASVSAIVRRFIEERFAVQAPRQTSEELLQAARASADFPQPGLEPLAALLAECDRVKFTGMAPTRGESEEIVTRGCQFVRDSCDNGTD